jgi:hypothetical protein
MNSPVMDAGAAELAGILVHSGLYGVYLMLSIVSIYCLHRVRGKSISPNKVVVATSGVLFVTITTFYVVSVITVVVALVDYQGSILSTLSSTATRSVVLVRNATYCLTIILMDALLTYRLYVIYMGNAWIVVFPLFAIFCAVASTCMQVILLARGDFSGGWIIANSVSSTAVSSYSTSLIVIRILREGRAFHHFGTKNIFLPVLYLTIETRRIGLFAHRPTSDRHKLLRYPYLYFRRLL